MSNKLLTQLEEVENHIKNSDAMNIKVSKSSVAWHIDHMVKVINKVIGTLKQSDFKSYKWSFNILRIYCFALGYFPRGKAKAPKAVISQENINSIAIESQLESAKQNIYELDTLQKKANFSHHVFGLMNKKQTKRFLEIHTMHHLKIIRDILSQ